MVHTTSISAKCVFYVGSKGKGLDSSEASLSEKLRITTSPMGKDSGAIKAMHRSETELTGEGTEACLWIVAAGRVRK